MTVINNLNSFINISQEELTQKSDRDPTYLPSLLKIIFSNRGLVEEELKTKLVKSVHILKSAQEIDVKIYLIAIELIFSRKEECKIDREFLIKALDQYIEKHDVFMTELILSLKILSSEELSAFTVQAFQKKSVEILKLLISSGASPNSEVLGLSLLGYSLEERDIELAKFLLKNGADINKPVQGQTYPLHKACEIHRLDFVKLFVEAGANVALLNENHDTPLHCACRLKGSVQNEDFEMITYLVANGGDINAANKLAQTPLFEACRKNDLNFVKFLIEKIGAEVNSKDPLVESPLKDLFYLGYRSLIELLISKGANLEKRNLWGDTFLHQMCQNKNLEMVKLLLDSKADIYAFDKRGFNAFHGACQVDAIEILEELFSREAALISTPTQYNQLPLEIAIERKNSKIVNFLFSKKIDLNPIIEKGKATDNAEHYGLLHLFARNGDVKGVIWALNMGMSINCRAPNGNTPLHEACWSGSLEIVKMLIEEKIDKGAAIEKGETLGSDGSECEDRELPNSRALQKVHLNVQNKKRQTPIKIALNRGHATLVKFLFAQGAETPAMSYRSKGVHRFYTPLHFLAYEKDKIAIKELLEKGASINLRCPLAFTPIDVALARDPEIARFMIKHFNLSFEAALAIKFYGHLHHQSGFYQLGECEINYQGYNYLLASQQLSRFGGGFFVEKKEEILSKFPRLNEEDCLWFQDVFSRAYENCTKDPHELIKEIQQKKMAIIVTGWDRHIVASVIDNEISRDNLGAGSGNDKGISLFSMGLKENLPEVIRYLQKDAASAKGKNRFYSEMTEKLKLIPKNEFDIELTKQSTGNCGWTSIEASFVDVIARYLRKHQNFSHAEATEYALRLCKLWREEYVIPKTKQELLEVHKIEVTF